MISAVVNIVLAIIGWFTGKKKATEERLGAEEAANVSLRAGLETIRKADDAARKVEQKAPAHDPNDLDA